MYISWFAFSLIVIFEEKTINENLNKDTIKENANNSLSLSFLKFNVLFYYVLIVSAIDFKIYNCVNWN